MVTARRSRFARQPLSLWGRLFLFVVLLLAFPACRRPAAPGPAGAPPAPGVRAPSAGLRIGVAALRVTFLDVGQGDSALVQAPDGETMLIDAGDTDQSETVLAALRGRGIDRLDWAVASHPHADHIGGFLDVLPAIHAQRFLDSAFATGSRVQQKVLERVRDGGTEYRKGRAGEMLDIGGVKVEVLAPTEPWVRSLPPEGTNNASIVMRLTYGKTRFLFTGDMEEDERAQVYQNPEGRKLAADVLKVAHHGSHNGTDAEFLRRVRPRFAVISCGAGNEYGHPHKEALQALQHAGVKVFRTDRDGTIAVTSDGARLDWQTHAPSGASSETPARAEPPAGAQVIGNRRTHVYHRPDCPRLPAKANQVVFPDAKAAREAGYRPDPLCAP